MPAGGQLQTADCVLGLVSQTREERTLGLAKRSSGFTVTHPTFIYLNMLLPVHTTNTFSSYFPVPLNGDDWMTNAFRLKVFKLPFQILSHKASKLIPPVLWNWLDLLPPSRDRRLCIAKKARRVGHFIPSHIGTVGIILRHFFYVSWGLISSAEYRLLVLLHGCL